ncbi:IS110 family transposase [Moraxella nasovis]|uniref:IS110 family transposase n=1 Tax=Moraxella nasovis TaxID=2904121 RepID=UPI001F604760|nr:IS110 family transposase [Moraxella nasovis]UNU73034.1 IS110 family transposase [Moraxella nasovis]UNU73036.1 IS110 family transposase [Moraxella nasovis]UNU73839.1 IS110 family transposase [Moraxella nasovis]
MTYYVGIDVSKHKLDVAWLKELSTMKVKTKVFNNHFDDFEHIIHWLKTNLGTDVSFNDIHLIMEATGVYHEPLAYYLHDLGFKVSIINPAFVKHYADSLGVRQKTDKKDSIVLARYGRATHPDAWIAPSIEARHLKSLLSRLDALNEDLQREENRKEKAEVADTTPIVKQSIDEMIVALKLAISKLNQDIDTHINNHPKLKEEQTLLQSIKGVGQVISRQMLTLFNTKQFNNAKQVSAFLGLIPKQQESGLFKGRSRLAKTGNAQLRAKLYMAAVVATKYNPDIKDQYERLQQNGKCKMQALCACMRKLVQICFGVIKHQTPYTPQVRIENMA